MGLVTCAREKGEALAKELGEGTQFSQFDFEDAETLKSILSGNSFQLVSVLIPMGIIIRGVTLNYTECVIIIYHIGGVTVITLNMLEVWEWHTDVTRISLNSSTERLF